MDTAIFFHLEDLNYKLEHKKAIKEWLLQTILSEEKTPGEINIILCSDTYLHKINVDYLEHDTYTDIITVDYVKGNLISGDLFISVERIKENAKQLNTGLKNELHRVMVHGVLHLLGYKDKQATDKELMTSKEDFYLSLREF